MFSPIGKGQQQPKKDKAQSNKQNVLKPNNQQLTGKQSQAGTNAKKNGEAKATGKPKTPANTANNAGGDKAKKKSKGSENSPGLAVHIDLKNFSETTQSATKRLKYVTVLNGENVNFHAVGDT